jgi:hypothetical protein
MQVSSLQQGARIFTMFLVLALVACGGGASNAGGGNGTGSNSTIASVSASCSPSSINVNQTSKCSSTVTGSGNFNSAVTWSVDSGSIDQSGNYTAPGTPTTATVKAISSQDSTKSDTANIAVTATGPALASVTLKPTNVVSGNSSTGTVRSSTAAPNGGISVILSNTDSSVASVPASVTIQAGSTSAQFTVVSANVSTAQVVTITASAGTTVNATLTVNPAGTVNWSGGPGPTIPITNQCFVGDFNGDGRADLACYTGSSGSWNVALSTGKGWQSEFWNSGPSPVVYPIFADCFVGDFNGDGRSDIACYTNNGTAWDVALSIGSGWQNSMWSGGPQPIVPISTQCFPGDLNGDHKTDIACWTESSDVYSVALSTGTGWISQLWTGGPYGPVGFFSVSECIIADFLGFGLVDIACGDQLNGWQVSVSLGNTFGPFPNTSGAPSLSTTAPGQCLPGDFNGDSKYELACYTSNAAWDVALPTGTGWNTQVWSNGPLIALPVTNQCFAADFNGDRKTDLACYSGGSGIWGVSISTGTGWNSSLWNGGAAPGLPVTNYCFVGDFNGDGNADVACYTGTAGVWAVALSAGDGW